MNIVLRFYENYWSNEIVHQEIVTGSLEIDEELVTFNVAKFDMPIFAGLHEFMKIKIYESDSNNDVLKFEGYVYEITPKWRQFSMVGIECRSSKAILQSRKALQDYALTNKDIKEVFETVLAKYNSDFGDARSVQSDFTYNIASLEVSIDDEYFGLFDELCEQTESYWTVFGGVVIISKNSGKDMTNSAIAMFDGNSPDPGNINNASLKTSSTRASIVIVKEINGDTRIDSSKYDGYCYGVADKTIRKGCLTEKTDKFYENINKPQSLFNFEVINDSIVADIGDKIWVDITNTNSFYDYQGEAYILTKKIIYNTNKTVIYGFGEFIVSPFSMLNRQAGIEKQIKLIKLKSV